MLLTHAKHRFAPGLHWSVHDTVALARRQARETPRASTVRAVFRDEPSAGEQYALGVYEGRVRGEVLCAALAVGLVLPHAVVRQTLEDGSVWLCVISNGLPFPEQDRILGADEAAAALQDVKAYAPDLVGDLPGAARTLHEVLGEFEARVTDRRLSRKQCKAIRLQSQSPTPGQVGRYAALLLVPALGLFVWQFWQKNQTLRLSQDASLARVAESREETARAAALRQERVQAFHQKLERERAELAASRGQAAGFWQQWNRIRRGLPVSAGGYVPAALRCEATSCVAAWSARTTWTRIEDKRLIPGWMSDTDPAPSAQAAYAVQPVLPSSLPAPTWASAAALRLQLAGAMQFLAPGMQIDAPQALVVSAPPELGLPAQTLGARGALRLSFQGPTALVQAQDVLHALAKWPVRLDSASWAQLATSQPSVEVQGSYVFIP